MPSIDKSARLAEEAAKREQETAKKASRLNLPFPYKVIPFDPGFFRVR